jgi:hypothetical protein
MALHAEINAHNCLNSFFLKKWFFLLGVQASGQIEIGDGGEEGRCYSSDICL